MLSLLRWRVWLPLIGVGLGMVIGCVCWIGWRLVVGVSGRCLMR